LILHLDLLLVLTIMSLEKDPIISIIFAIREAAVMWGLVHILSANGRDIKGTVQRKVREVY
jgi:hypothetical protein